MSLIHTPVTAVLLVANIVLSIYVWNEKTIFQKWMMHPYSFQRKKTYYTLLTSAFIHADTIHLAMNMFALLSFGQFVELELGKGLFAVLYGVSILTSSVPSLIKHRNNPSYYTLGASGAISAVVFAFILLHPFAKLGLFLLPINIPAILFGVLYILFSIYAQRRSMDNLNHDAHIAGALTGVCFILLLKPQALNQLF
jgi:membrane associated rhomboid family serine protease